MRKQHWFVFGIVLLILVWPLLASGIASVISVFGQTGVVNTPVTTLDISTPSNPASGKTVWYTKAGTLCSLNPTGTENCTGSTAGIFYQTVDNSGSALPQEPALNFMNGITCVDNGGSSRTDCSPSTNAKIRSFGGSLDGGGNPLSSGKTTYVTVPFACTIAGYNILVDTGTVSFDVWKVATGTAIPTVSNSILTGGFLAIATGTALHSTTLTAFTTTTVTANDIVGVNIEAVSGATFAQLVLQCNAGT